MLSPAQIILDFFNRKTSYYHLILAYFYYLNIIKIHFIKVLGSYSQHNTMILRSWNEDRNIWWTHSHVFSALLDFSLNNFSIELFWLIYNIRVQLTFTLCLFMHFLIDHIKLEHIIILVYIWNIMRKGIGKRWNINYMVSLQFDFKEL